MSTHRRSKFPVRLPRRLARGLPTRHRRLWLLGVLTVAATATGVGAAAADHAAALTAMPVLATTPIAGGPAPTAVDTATGETFVATDETPGVSVLSTASGQVLRSFATAQAGLGIAVDPGAGRLLLTDGSSNEVSELDESTGQLLAQIPVPMAALQVAVDPTTHLAFVTGLATRTLVVLDVTTMTVVATTTLSSYGFDVAVDPALGQVYVTDGRSGTLMVTNESGVQLSSTTLPGAGFDVAVDPVRHVQWVSMPNQDAVAKVTGGVIAAVLPTGAFPEGLAVDPASGTVYTSSFADGVLQSFDAVSDAPLAVNALGGSPTEVTVDPQRHVVVAVDSFAGRAVFLTGRTGTATQQPAPLGSSRTSPQTTPSQTGPTPSTTAPITAAPSTTAPITAAPSTPTSHRHPPAPTSTPATTSPTPTAPATTASPAGPSSAAPAMKRAMRAAQP